MAYVYSGAKYLEAKSFGVLASVAEVSVVVLERTSGTTVYGA